MYDVRYDFVLPVMFTYFFTWLQSNCRRDLKSLVTMNRSTNNNTDNNVEFEDNQVELGNDTSLDLPSVERRTFQELVYCTVNIVQMVWFALI